MESTTPCPNCGQIHGTACPPKTGLEGKLTIEDFEFVTGIRIKGTGEVIEFDDDYWTEILSEVYFFSE